MSLTGLALQGFLLGLALSPTCLGFCLPLLAPFFTAEQRTLPENAKAFGAFLAGRFAGYAAVGLAAGWLGQQIFVDQRLGRILAGSAWLLTGLVLELYAVMKSFPRWSLCRSLAPFSGTGRTPLVLGLLTGVNICPPFVAVILQAGNSGGPWNGLVTLTAFFAGTSLILLPLPLIGLAGQARIFRWAGRLAAGFAGGWFVFQGFRQLLG